MTDFSNKTLYPLRKCSASVHCSVPYLLTPSIKGCSLRLLFWDLFGMVGSGNRGGLQVALKCPERKSLWPGNSMWSFSMAEQSGEFCLVLFQLCSWLGTQRRFGQNWNASSEQLETVSRTRSSLGRS